MDIFDKFISVLNKEELARLKKELIARADEYQKLSDEDLVDTLMPSITWSYRMRAESVTDSAIAKMYENRRLELICKWKELGLIKD
ncbi:hypothetical protein [uncultured Mitsuokella sp.]|uniref:hypothetical protein n=1 Tax=uncultured Mitsuokella sp. TaxID=453120 RepID=UPI0025EEABF5|nr:hypothetical protein [uncultured Mitsuokella sp.]